jgi:hypothetical protein
MLKMAIVLLLCVHDATKQVKPFEHSLAPWHHIYYVMLWQLVTQNDTNDCYLIILETLLSYVSLSF